MMLPPDCTKSTAKCVHRDGTPWSNMTEMCPTCTLTCPDTKGWGFCDRSAASDMIMQGFVSFGFKGSSTTPCVILFFRDWVLDSCWKFWLGTFGVFMLSILLEGVASLQPRGKHVRTLLPLMYTWRMAVAYLVMLAAMTFCVEIFLAAVCGLGTGHALFRRLRPVGGLSGPTLCCSHGPIENRQRVYRNERNTPILQADDNLLLHVHGMTCGSCTLTVENALERVAGVVSARVSLGDVEVGGRAAPGVAEVWVNAGFSSVEAAIAAVEDVGFQATRLSKR